MPDPLQRYQSKRDFAVTPEPAHGGKALPGGLRFVVQKHWARQLHYDFRLELDGSLKSWAVPKGPSCDPHDKRMAVQVEDHPIAYADFEGTIPEKQYGAGQVIVWDKGTWVPEGDPHEGLRRGELKFALHGHKLQGRWVLVRMKGKSEKQVPWLLIKEKDAHTRPAPEFSVVDAMPDSVQALAMPEMRPAADAHAAVPHAARTAKRKRSITSESVAPEGKKAELPATLSPQLATLVDAPPSTPEDWLFEIKFDGYRLLTRVQGSQIKLLTRNGKDWTPKLTALHQTLHSLQLPDGWYDGEIVVHDQQGRPDFGLLQQAFDGSDTQAIVYYLFDVPYLNGEDLRLLPLTLRRQRLQALLEKAASDTVRFSAELVTDPQTLPQTMLAAACRMGLEGVIGKRRDAPYVTRRSPDWIKLKCGQRQEFVIGGYTDPQGARVGLGALLLGYHDEAGVLQYAGKVGTGFDVAALRGLKARLDRITTRESPFPPGAVPGERPHWVQPELMAEVRFAEWTRGGAVRGAVFHGLREDKPARAITREAVRHVAAESADNSWLPADLTVTHPDRVIDPQSGCTKLELVRYYAQVGTLMMAHLSGRPVALVRAPDGVGKALFFQKHADTDTWPGFRQMNPELDPDHAPMLEVVNARGILSAAQWNVVEFHTQNALGKAYEKPNRMVFDLDPGEGVGWPAVQEAAQLVHAFLNELGLSAYLKTSGGKGLHVVVPIKGSRNWDTVKDFSQAIVQHLSVSLPQRFAFKSGPRNRVGKIFIDYLRNGRGATTVCAWSARARPGLGISVPIGWDEMDSLKASDQWTLRNVCTRLAQGNAPWHDYAQNAKTLTAAMKALGFKPAA